MALDLKKLKNTIHSHSILLEHQTQQVLMKSLRELGTHKVQKVHGAVSVPLQEALPDGTAEFSEIDV